MFSAFKKLTTSAKSDDGGTIPTPRGLQTMSQSLQKKFSRGVQYNMKIVIKGDRNVGKTCLFHRLQGNPFLENYIPTDEIQVTSIQWSYKVTDDVVKVEVWDVVDKGKKRILNDSLKLTEQIPASASTLNAFPALDAEFLDIYKSTNGVILVMDVTKSWTFEYVQREIDKIPDTIPVLIIGNHCDMGHHRAINSDQASFYAESLQRAAPVRYAECSMYNGFGLKFLHKWFNLPFLQLQRQTLLAQLSTNEREIDVTNQELNVYQQSDETNYDLFLSRLSTHRRKLAELNSAVPSVPIQNENSQSKNITGIQKDTKNVCSTVNPTSKSNGRTENSIVDHDRGSYVKKIYGKGQEIIPEKAPASSTVETGVSDRLNTSLRNIEEFMPDECLDRSFLDDSTNPASNLNVTSHNRKIDGGTDSDESIEGNPLVSELQEDLDPSDGFIQEKNSTSKDLTFDYVSDWARSTESRRSPDGGEDNNTMVDLLNASEKDQNSNSKTDKKSKSHKSDSNSNEKHKKNKSSKREKRQSKEQNELEQFLNFSVEEGEYEAM